MRSHHDRLRAGGCLIRSAGLWPAVSPASRRRAEATGRRDGGDTASGDAGATTGRWLPVRAVLGLLALAWASSALAATKPITVLNPRGGEVFVASQVMVVQLGKKNRPVITIIDLSTDGGATWSPIGQINKQDVNPALRHVLLWTVVDPATLVPPQVSVSFNCVIRASGPIPASTGLSATFSIGVGDAIAGEHGALTGLADDDHLQYLNRSGVRPMTGDLTLAGAPTADLHAATKKYVDDSNTSQGTGQAATDAAQDTAIAAKVSKSGDTMTGLLTLSGAPIANLDAATKKYVDDNNTAQDTAQLATDGAQNTAIGGKVSKSGDTMTGNLKLPIAGPVANEDAATKKYVDDSIAAQGSTQSGTDAAQDAAIAGKVSKSGDTMTGLLTLSGAPTANLHAATKKYVDDANTAQDTVQAATNTAQDTAITGKVSKAGDTMSGALNMSGNNITGLGTNLTASGALTVGATGVTNDLTLSSSRDIILNATSGDITLNASDTTINLNANTAVSGTLAVAEDDATADNITNILTLTHTTLGTAAAGIGAGVLLRSEDSGGSTEDAAQISAVLTSVANGSEASELRFLTRTGGAALTQGMSLNGSGDLTVVGTVNATSFVGNGAGLTGIGSGTGGVINTGSTTIGADSDIDGVGEIALQTRTVTRLTVTNSGNVGIGTALPGSLLTSAGTIESTAGGFKCPDGTVLASTSTLWGTTGNAGTTPGTNFIGTTDANAFEIHVDEGGTANEGRRRVMRFEPNAKSPNILAGYNGNTIKAGVVGGTICGGGTTTAPYGSNGIYDDYCVVAGGTTNQAGSNNSLTTDATHCSVLGGIGNQSRGGLSVVCGGQGNDASGGYAAILAGYSNNASSTAATICGGLENSATGVCSFVGGGLGNLANGGYSVVGGGGWGQGINNVANGQASVIPGGEKNAAAGDYSFAAGRRAKANHQGAYVWADSTDADFASDRADQVKIRATGGSQFNVNNGGFFEIRDDATDLVTTSTGAHLTVGGAWTNSSDRNKKENFAPLDGAEVLEKLAGLPVTRWNYKAEGPQVKHAGPMAQDFHAAFGLGGDNRSITTVDASGVALVAIQELKKRNDDLARQNRELKARLEKVEAALGTLTGK